jgi:hypothetical protein
VAVVYDDGTRKDVTLGAQLVSSNKKVAEVRPDGSVDAHGYGEAVVTVSYMRRSVTARVIVPRPCPKPFPVMPANNRIDELVLAKLEQMGLPPSELCTDEVFLRRAYLTVIGILPTADEAKAFLADKDPKKRAKLIDRLLDRDEYADYQALRWGDILRIKSERGAGLLSLGASQPGRQQAVRPVRPRDAGLQRQQFPSGPGQLLSCAAQARRAGLCGVRRAGVHGRAAGVRAVPRASHRKLDARRQPRHGRVLLPGQA